MDIFTSMTERSAIKRMFEEHELTIVHFDNLFILDENEKRTEIISIKLDKFSFVVTLEINGELSTTRLDNLSHIFTTMIYLRLQKMIREFNN